MSQTVSTSLVSVVMPAYNQAEYIHEAIASVLSQTHLTLELIIIDNFSTDTTEKIVNSFNDERIQYYKFHNHGVIAASRNHGVTKASGKYIAFIDSDDIWESFKLEYQIPHMQNASCVSSSFKPIGDIDESGHYLNSILDGEFKDFGYDEVVLENPVITSSVLISRDVFLNAEGFDEDDLFRFIEDWELWLRIAYHGAIRVLNEPLVQYRIYYKQDRDLRNVRERVLQIFDKHHGLGLLSDKMLVKARGNCYISIGRAFLNLNDTKGVVFYVKGLFYSDGARNKARAIAGLLLFLIPKSIRCLVVKKTSQISNLFVWRVK